MSRARLAWGAAALGVVALVVLAFQPAFAGQFLSFDDPENFTRNHFFRGLGAEELAWMLRTAHMGHYQPLSWLTLAADWARGGGLPSGQLDPAPFHATNVALHALGALCVGLLARELFAARGVVAGRLAGCVAAACLFAVHPMRAESVVWITERRDVLSAPFFVLCLAAWVRRGALAAPGAARAWGGAGLAASACGLALAGIDRSQPGRLDGNVALLVAALGAWAASLVVLGRGAGGRWFAASALMLFASLCAKAWGIVVPALLLVLDVWPLGRVRDARTALALVLEKAPFAALSVVFALLAKWAQSSQMATVKSLAEHSLVERAAQGAYGLCYYAWRHVWPRDLSPIYELPETLSFAQARFLVPLVVLLGLAAVLVALRRRAPWLVAAALAYAILLSPVLGVLQSGPQLVADRYGYLAGIPLALLVGGGLATLVALPRARPFALAGGALVLAALTLATRAQARLWSDSETLWRHAVRVEPESPLAYLSLGSVVLEQNTTEPDPARRRALIEEARGYFLRGIELERQPRLLANLALVEGTLAELDPAGAAEHRARALEWSTAAMRRAEELDLVEIELRLNHATHLFNAGRIQEALPILATAVRVRPRLVGARERYGIALLAVGRLDEAQAEFEAVLALEPGHPRARDWLARVAAARRGG